MKHTHKWILSIFAAAALSFCSLPQGTPLLLRPAVTASAADTSGICGDNVRWAYDEATNTLTISGKGPMYDFEPNFEPIVPIPWSGFCKNIKKIVIGSGITTIGKNAFQDCRSVTEVYIPDGVTSIGWNSFTFCYALTSVRLPQTLTSIDNNAFTYCRNLTEIVIPDNVSNIGPNAFEECTSLKSVKLPASLQYIFATCFRNCPITQISIPSNVRVIGEKAFDGCLLTAVTVPASVEKIYQTAIPCSTLRNVTILNPSCEIVNDERTFYSEATIHGYAGSTAEVYAKKYNRRFVALPPPATTTTTTTTTTTVTTTTTTTVTTTATTTTTTTTTSAAPALQRGDADGNGTVSVEDAQLAMLAYVQTLSGLENGLTEQQVKAADINGDKTVSVEDAQIILIYYVSNTLSGQNVTWDDLLSKKTQTLPRLLGKVNIPLNLK